MPNGFSIVRGFLLVLFAGLILPEVGRADSLSTSATVRGQVPSQQCTQTGTTSASCSASASVFFVAPNPDTYFFGGNAQAKPSFGSLGTFANAVAQCNVTTGGVNCGLPQGFVDSGASFEDAITINPPAVSYL